MDKIVALDKAFEISASNISLPGFILNLFLTLTLAYLLRIIYIKFGSGLSNRNALSANFPLISITTMLIITIVKSSLALSLGLVGALSIVRFRTAIKEPEELAYLFLCLTIGLGFGANQRIITMVALLFIAVFIYARSKFSSHRYPTMVLLLVGPMLKDIDLDDLIVKLQKDCLAVELKRFDESEDNFEISFSIETNDYRKLSKIRGEIKKLYPKISISFLDNSGIF